MGETKLIGSLRTFFSEIQNIQFNKDCFYFYRGHSDFEWELIPSIYRKGGWIRNEDKLLKEIIIQCPEDFRDCKTTFEHLVKMQHYSMPTRMLDITQNSLVALYFACLKNENENSDGEVVIFEIPKNDVKYFDSDTASVIANLSKRTNSLNISDYYDLNIEDFNGEDEIQLLLHEIRQEKPYFKGEIIPSHINSVLCVKPKLDNPRIVRQDGLFFIFGMNMSKDKCANFPSKYLLNQHVKILINGKKKEIILEQLEKLGISNRKLFPEITSVAEDLKNAYGIDYKRVTLNLFGKKINLRR
jgi:FRG domain